MYIYYIKPKFATYVLQNLHVQFVFFHVLMLILNCCKDLDFFIFAGGDSHIIGPLHLMDSMPLCTVLTLGICQHLLFIKSREKICSVNISCIGVGEMP